MAAEAPTVVIMCGLPASGKTTTAAHLHARLGGVLIRSCDVYQDLGISLPAWVRQTRGFTLDVSAYDRVRDQAYSEMAARLHQALIADPTVVTVDAVHGERGKRAVVYGICHAHGATPALILCRCDDLVATTWRKCADDSAPEKAASTSRRTKRVICLSFETSRNAGVIPLMIGCQTGRTPTVITYDTPTGVVRISEGAGVPRLERILASLRAQP